jgi:hypothetical protein
MERICIIQPDQENGFSERIKNAVSINEIIAAIKELNSLIIDEEGRELFPNHLVGRIEQVRHGHLEIDSPFNPNALTNRFGIKDKVSRLLKGDKTYIKYTKGSKAKKK